MNSAMTSNFSTIALRDLLEPERSISYGIVQPGQYCEDGVPIVRVSDVRDGRVSTSNPLRVSPSIENKYSRTRLRGGELLLTLVGSVGEAAVASEDLAGWNVARAIAVIPVREDIGAYWVQLALNSPEVKHVIDYSLNTTVQATLNLRDVAGLPIALPSRNKRHAITHILGTLDDKIELNRRMSETLEGVARAIFKSWFVDFDPVRAKVESRDTGLPDHIADLFPDSFVDSELGEIPKGWEVAPIGNLVQVLGGSTPSTKKSEYWEGGEIHWTTPKDLSGMSSPVLIDTARKITKQGLDTISSGLLPEGTLLLSSRAPVGYLAISQVPIAVNQGYIAIPPGGDVSPLFLLYWAYHHMNEIKQRAGGTTFAEISKRNFRPIPLVIADRSVRDAFQEFAEPLFDRIVECDMNTITLSSIRNTLLPKLISGELRIEDTERFLPVVSND